ncbi:MAG: hypothetical protein U0Q11_10865 [Vicinamibacterales bacterium]
MSRVGRLLPALCVVALCVALIFVVRRGGDAPTTSDAAVIESYVRLATQGLLRLGAYSRFQWHHPGPLYFYVLAPFYVFGGSTTSTLNAGAAAISFACVWLVASVLIRRRPSMAVATGAMLLLLAFRSGEALASPWNPHVTLLPMLALLVVTADVIAGAAGIASIRSDVLTSLAGRAHVAVMPVALLRGALAFARACAGAVVSSDSRAWRRSLVVTGCALLVAWVLPAWEQLTGTPHGNITELWRFFVQQSRPGQTLAIAVSAWSDMFTGLLRPDYYVAHGWPFVESPVKWAEWTTLGVLAAVAVRSAICVRRRESFSAALGALVLLVAAIALWSTRHIDDRIFDHDVFWMVGLGALALALLLDALLTLALRRASSGIVARGVAVVLIAGTCWPVFDEVRAKSAASLHPSSAGLTARALANDLETYMQREGVTRPLVLIDQDAWEYVAGAVLDLQKRGRLVSFEEDWVVMFTPEFRVTGREDVVITIAVGPLHQQLAAKGAREISAHEPVFAHVERVSRP